MGNQNEHPMPGNAGDNIETNESTNDVPFTFIDMRSQVDSNLAFFLRNTSSQPYLDGFQVDMNNYDTAFGAPKTERSSLQEKPEGQPKSAMHQQGGSRFREILRDLDLFKREDYRKMMQQTMLTDGGVEQPQLCENVDPVRPAEPDRPVPEAKLPPIKPTLEIPKIPTIDDLLRRHNQDRIDAIRNGRSKNLGQGDGTIPGESKPMVRRPEAGKAPVTDAQLEALIDKYQISPKYRISPKLLLLERERAEREGLHKTFTPDNLEKLLRVAHKYRLVGHFNEQDLHSLSRPGEFIGKLIPELLSDPDTALTKGQLRLKEAVEESMRASLADQASIDNAMRNVDRKLASVKANTRDFIEELKKELRKPKPRTDLSPDTEFKPGLSKPRN